MSAGGRPGRFVLAPVVNGAAAWEQGTALLLAPMSLSPWPVVVPVVPFRRSRGPR